MDYFSFGLLNIPSGIGFLTSVVIIYKLFRMRRIVLTFINKMFLLLCTLDVILMTIQSTSMTNIGMHVIFTSSFLGSDGMLSNCTAYTVSRTLNNITTCFLNLGMMFLRFVYVRYPHGLLELGLNMFHEVVMLWVGAFLIIVITSFYAESYVNGDKLEKILMFKICMLGDSVQIDQSSGADELGSVVVGACIFTLFLLLSSSYMFVSSKQKANIFSIPKRRRNLLTMSQQLLFILFFCLNAFSIQCYSFLNTESYNNVERNKVFLVWWAHQYTYSIINNLLLKLWIIHDASSNLEYFDGTSEKTCTEKNNHPRPMRIQPRRDSEIELIYYKKLHHVKKSYRQPVIQRRLEIVPELPEIS